MNIRLFEVTAEFKMPDAHFFRKIVTLGVSDEDAITRVRNYLLELWPPQGIQTLKSEPLDNSDCYLVPEPR